MIHSRKLREANFIIFNFPINFIVILNDQGVITGLCDYYSNGHNLREYDIVMTLLIHCVINVIVIFVYFIILISLVSLVNKHCAC